MQQSLFKRRRTEKSTGKVKLSRTWYCQYKLDGQTKPTRVNLGTTDKRVAEQRLRELVCRAERELAGLVLPPDQVDAASTPLLDLLAEHIRQLKRDGLNKQYVWDVDDRCRHLFERCGWERLRDITAASFLDWRGRQTGKSPKTLNDYLACIRGLLRGLLDAGRLGDDPLAGVKRLQVKGRETFKRWPMTVLEFDRLLRVAGRRRVLYLTAALTGLRRGTLFDLRWFHVLLDADPPRIEIPAAMQKNREASVHYLRDDLVQLLRETRPQDAAPSGRVFEGLLPRSGLVFLKNDLESVGLVFEDRELRLRRDFHSLRHTACTWAGATGVAGPTLQAFTGHKDARQVKRYTHEDHLPQREVLDRLPRFDEAVLPRGTRKRTNAQDAEWPERSRPGVRRNRAEEVASAGEDVSCRDAAQPVRKYPVRDSNPCYQDENLAS